jgi:hypothetical protein
LGRLSTPAGREAPYRASLLLSCNTYLGRFVVCMDRRRWRLDVELRACRAGADGEAGPRRSHLSVRIEWEHLFVLSTNQRARLPS